MRTRTHSVVSNLSADRLMLGHNLAFASFIARRGDVEVDLRRIAALQDTLHHLWVKGLACTACRISLALGSKTCKISGLRSGTKVSEAASRFLKCTLAPRPSRLKVLQNWFDGARLLRAACKRSHRNHFGLIALAQPTRMHQ